jgi:hypothetical protein
LTVTVFAAHGPPPKPVVLATKLSSVQSLPAPWPCAFTLIASWSRMPGLTTSIQPAGTQLS